MLVLKMTGKEVDAKRRCRCRLLLTYISAISVT